MSVARKPFHRQPVAKMPVKNCNTPDAKGEVRILVAADDRSGRETLRDLIASWGCSVVRAVTGDQVLEQVQAFAPHVLLLDLRGTTERRRSCFA